MEQIEKFKFKRLVKQLESLKGNGTSVVTILLPPNSQISKMSQKLTDEMGTASNIKSRVNRNATIDAIVSAQTKLKLYNHCPKNGLVVLAGEVANKEGKIKKITFNIEPIKPLATSLYRCDDKFHIESLKDMLDDDDPYGFIIIGGEGLYLATIKGNSKTIHVNYGVDLPKKHKKGGQSAQRFGRLYQEARQNYLTKANEMISNTFIDNAMPNVKGLIVAGNAELKQKLIDAQTFDPRLKPLVIGVLDTAYDFENGLNEALNKAAPLLQNNELIKEKKILEKFFDNINRETGKYVFGIKETMDALEAGMVDDLIVWNNLEEQKEDSEELLLDWVLEHIGEFGANLHVVSDRTVEGTQLVKGFGGLVGTLKYKLTNTVEEVEDTTHDVEVKEENYEFDFI